MCMLWLSRMTDVHHFFFFLRYDEQQNRMEGSPALIEQQWPGIPSPIDAAVLYEGSAALGFYSPGDGAQFHLSQHAPCSIDAHAALLSKQVLCICSREAFATSLTSAPDKSSRLAPLMIFWSARGITAVNKFREDNRVTQLMKLLQRSSGVCWSMYMGTKK